RGAAGRGAGRPRRLPRRLRLPPPRRPARAPGPRCERRALPLRAPVRAERRGGMTTTKERVMTLAELRKKLAELPPEWEHAPVVATGREEQDVTGATGAAVLGKDGTEYAVMLRIRPTLGRRFTPAPPDVDAIKAGALALIEVVLELATVETELAPEDFRAYGERVYNHAVAILGATGIAREVAQ